MSKQDETDLEESVVAAAQLAVKLQVENKALRESLKKIRGVKLDPQFGELNYQEYDEWAKEKICEIANTIRNETRKHGIY